MPESEEHKNLREEVACILEGYGWRVYHDRGDTRRPDIFAIKNKQAWRIEIEISGSNIDRDLNQGAETFVTSPDRLGEITLEVAFKSKEAKVVDIERFREEVIKRSALKN